MNKLQKIPGRLISKIQVPSEIHVKNESQRESEVSVFSKHWKLNETCRPGESIKFDIRWGTTPVFIGISEDPHVELVDYDTKMDYLIMPRRDQNIIVRYEK